MKLFKKKTIVSMLMLFVLALAIAIPASAADQDYTFYNPATSSTSHASSSIDGPAVVTEVSPGNYQVQITLKNQGTYMGITLPASYAYLNADVNGAPSGDGVYEVTATRSATSTHTTFTFSGLTNSTYNVPIQLQTTVAGFHSSVHTLVIDWN
ncbi:hypothetical protein SAMN02799630_05916 [Paenibacillus sp. UNCCL117]|uniref:hypothetical protein n=1 Tax=unclassified Paenibacillus TaxID=185978 RepID=UPI00088F535B|nr:MULTISPECIES: hypothetical protein [unclassified Paenibacillus]SDE60731.1 hypothetical protein SAMN04488602_13536 [Paenibacillus sp. cl123]SFW69615.1 hypothetical protein SAMN02799630_05916 [Paenibacillus sp. UNCCL117]